MSTTRPWIGAARGTLRSCLNGLRVSKLIEAAPIWLFSAWAVMLVVRGHWPYIQQPYQQSIDEGYLLAAGQRMIHGRLLPFVDGVAHTGPLFLWTGAGIAALGEFSWLPIRIVAVIAFGLNTALVAACGIVAGRPLAGAIGSAAVPLFCILLTWSPDGLSYNAEVCANVFALLGLLAALRAVGSEERAVSLPWVVVAGTCATLTALAKQVGALMSVPIAVLIVVAAWARRDMDRTARRRLLAYFFGAAAVPGLIVLAWFASAGGLRDFYYYVVTYNRDIYMQFYADQSRLDSYRTWFAASTAQRALAFAAVGWGAGQLFLARAEERSWIAAYYRRGFVVTVAALAALSVIGARASMRDFDHYFILAVPWFGLLTGLVAEGASTPATPPRAAWLVGAHRAFVLLPIVLALEASWSVRKENLVAFSEQHKKLTNLTVAQELPPVCAYIQSHSAPDDSLFVWGFRPELYISCARRPASRFVFTSFVSGFVPWHFDSTKELEDANAVPGSRALLIAELEASKPPVIVDDAGRSLGARFIKRYDELARYMDGHYRLAESTGGEDVYLRLDAH
jgi:hypothetical protein